MGLTIHYALGSNTRSPAKARQLIARLRSHALDLPFERVHEIVELKDQACDFELCSRKDPHRWLLVQAGQSISLPVRGGGRDYTVAPTHIIAFDTLPGPGCEPANFGLCRYPAFIEVEERPVNGRASGLVRKRVRTGLAGWSWSSFCKTQYASNPDCGGVQNFLRCHLSVIRMLEHARRLDLLTDVNDEGRFWENGEVQALVEEIDEWDQKVSAFAGRVKDWYQADFEVQAPAFPDFEHLSYRQGQRCSVGSAE